jgi:sugar/nucleoside kinase (ribokinase family)
MLVCALGDLLLDVVARLERPLVTGADTPAHTAISAGGQAANAAAWVAALGAPARLIAKRADDEAGSLAAATLHRLGVELYGPVVAGRTGVVVSIVTQDAERSLASDRGVSAELHADELDAEWLAGCDHLHVSGYCLAGEPGRSAAVRAAELARAQQATVSIDLSASTVIEACGAGRFRDLVIALRPDVVFCNEDEDRAIGGAIAGTTWILKRGARGTSFDGDERPAARTEVVDATGAGDALAAGWILGGPELALEAAARCIATVGAMPGG